MAESVGSDDTKPRWVLVWYGWRGCYKRPVWYCNVKVIEGVAAREWGIGPVSIQRRVGW